jgi:hypothetical protein
MPCCGGVLPKAIRGPLAIFTSATPGRSTTFAFAKPRIGRTLAILADADEYMAQSEALIAALAPTQVMHVREHGHHGVMGNDAVKREAARFLTSPE